MIKVEIKRLLDSLGVGSQKAGEAPKLGPLAKLAQDDGLPVKTLFAVRRVLKACSSEVETYDATRVSILEQYTKKGEDGKILTAEGGAVVFLDDESEKQFRSEYDDLLNTEVELSVTPLTAASFEPRKLTTAPFLNAQDLFVLDWLILDDETDQDGGLSEALNG